ncbi:MAG: Crp/Fnr family transcriptional regulator [Proteobacteria bacterium]|nr:Crp/Fnr family transcriptional regulator [Pseudomonadota bacterium]
MPNCDLDVLANSRRLVVFERRQTIACENEAASVFFNVVSGLVKLSRGSQDGRTQIVGFRGPGEFFAAAETGRLTATVEAVGRVVLCKFSGARFKRLMRVYPQLSARLFSINRRRLETLENQLFLLGRMTAREKVTNFLLQHGFDSIPAGAPHAHCVRLPVTRAEIADFLGLTTETVSRVLASLVRERVITVGKSRAIHLIDVERLQRESGR